MGIKYKAAPKKLVDVDKLRPESNALPPRSTKFAMDDLRDDVTGNSWMDDDDLGLDLDDEPIKKGRAHREKKAVKNARQKKIGAVKLSN